MTEWINRLFDTMAAGAHGLGGAIDARKKCWPRLKLILNGEELGTELEELFGAAWALLLGLWFVLPLDAFYSVRAFSVLAMIGGEWVWGAALLCYGLWRLDSIVMNRVLYRHNASLCGVTIWSAFGFMMVAGNLASPGGAFFLLMAGLDALSYRNLREP